MQIRNLPGAHSLVFKDGLHPIIALLVELFVSSLTLHPAIYQVPIYNPFFIKVSRNFHL